MPTAAPMIVDSEIGVSMTRAAPYFGCRPRYCPKTPPRPTSSPTTTTRESAAIARSSAEHAASA
ncbi:hypothetical protein D3C83_72950 [compost metagenome]